MCVLPPENDVNLIYIYIFNNHIMNLFKTNCFVYVGFEATYSIIDAMALIKSHTCIRFFDAGTIPPLQGKFKHSVMFSKMGNKYVKALHNILVSNLIFTCVYNIVCKRFKICFIFCSLFKSELEFSLPLQHNLLVL